MGDGFKLVDPGRVEFNERLSACEISVLAADPAVRVLQTSKPVPAATWRRLNDDLFSRRSDVNLRLYGFYGLTCDLSVCGHLGNVRHFTADCLREARNLQGLAAMPALESLSVGVYGLTSFDFLERVPASLRLLSLGDTRSRKPDLSLLARFGSLRVVHLASQAKHIEVLAGLRDLEQVALRGITTPGLGYLRELPSLWRLGLLLGGIRELSALAGNRSLKHVELTLVRGLADISVLGRLPAVQYIHLESLRQVTRLPHLREATELRRLALGNMRGLSDLRPLASAPALEEFVCVQASHLRPEDLVPALSNPHLKRAWIGLGSDRKNAAVEALLRSRGIDRSPPTPFEVR